MIAPRRERAWLRRARALYADCAAKHFGADIPILPVVVNWRLRVTLANLVYTDEGRVPVKLEISGRHILSHGWRAVRDTMKHEMIHAWQAYHHFPVRHDTRFRMKARDMGICPCAREDVRPLRRSNGHP